MKSSRLPLHLRILVAFLVAVLLAGGSIPSTAASPDDSRMDWWRDARFGMFIHWGLYAVPAGKYDGKEVKGIGEWIMSRANIPRDRYEAYAPQFDPQQYDADTWVRIAKYAGMKYIVITSKHHDGFCLFDSAGQYDVVDAPPYGKDILADLRDACERHGVKFCTYYSIMDWHHPSQKPAKMNNGRPVWNPTQMIDGQKQQYVDYMKGHLKTLVEDYRTHVLWFDGEWPSWWTDQDGQELYQWLLELNPESIVNNRVGAGRKGMSGFTQEGSFAGDFGTPEQEIPATGVDSDWESCMTMNDTWGFKTSDKNWKSSQRLIQNLIDITSKGGNYLLNIGPKADGTFPQASVDRLRAIGQWMSVNGESIHGTQAALFRPDWGRVTRKDGTLYLHVFDWPSNGKLTIPALSNEVRRVSLLASPETTLNLNRDGETMVIDLPSTAPDDIASVITIDTKGEPALSK
ncbi:alpha-L-fucosidase [Crateriforma conspicua]|uniref:alpha-L-fucosidase n=1 Tax=Crateriforma conspicua TaxID=2527996 RepID=A0A5C6FK79_9PLAN|nr:alpha-L-fucosidase [Crateriforma conspicua]TWU61829.1 Alpha-L-fucosidase [Crateriforma conspicua]